MYSGLSLARWLFDNTRNEFRHDPAAFGYTGPGAMLLCQKGSRVPGPISEGG